MSCISFSNLCPSSGDTENVLLAKILQSLNEGGGGSGGGVTGLSVNGGPFQTGDVSIVTGGGSGTVTSVNGDPGPAVLLDSGEIPEGANLYYTQARFDTAFAAKSTTDLAEGTNLYFTEARVRGTDLAGFVATPGTVTAADTVLSAFEKLAGSALLNFTDEEVGATDAVIWRNAGVTEVLRVVGASGHIQLTPTSATMRLYTKGTDDSFTFLATTTKEQGAFLEVYGSAHANVAGAGISIHDAGIFQVLSAPVGSTASRQLFVVSSISDFVGVGPSTTPSANLDVNDSTTTTISYFYSTTDGLASPVNFARIEIVPGADADDAVIRTAAGGTGLVSNLPHILKVGSGQSVGTDIVAQSAIFRSGQSTGTGIRGDILFQQSPPGATGSAVNGYTTSWTINTAGALVATGGFAINAAAITLTARLSGTPITLTDAATIATDASLGNHFRVTLGGNRTLGNPTNPVDGQKAIWEFLQDGTGTRTITFDTQFDFGTDLTGFTLSTAAGTRDFIMAVYNAATTQWDVLAGSHGL